MTSRPTLPWSKVRECFERALPLSPAAREALLADPALDPAIAAEVRTLLAHEVADEPDGFLALPAAAAPDASRQGQRLGAWLIVERLGVGGMGEVWLAERADGAYNGQAAIKVLRRGMDSSQVLQRFAQEQQALARLQHPHIAQLIDAGRTPDGLPFFVMQQVQGQPIDAACVGLPLPARLALFLQLADAVSYAHRNLLVHRDLKPGNVLADSEGQVKLLDFGIAKALDPLESLEGLTTLGGQRPYTPHYASPEQIRGEPVSTATDIYSLGVLLYQMLTGTRPTGRHATTPAEAARSVLEDEPTRPSRLSAREAVDPQWITTRKTLEGDLDNILLKALEKTARATVCQRGCDGCRRARLPGSAAGQCARCPAAVPDGQVCAAQPHRRLDCGHGGAGPGHGADSHDLAGATGRGAGVCAACRGGGAGAGAGAPRGHRTRRRTRAGDDARAQLDRVKRIINDLVFRYGDTVTHMPSGAQAQEGMLRNIVTLLEPTVQGGTDDLDLIATMASVLGRLAEIQGNSLMTDRARAGEATATAERALALAERAWAQRRGDWRFASWHIRTLIVRAHLLRSRGQIDEARTLLELAATRAAAGLALQRDGEGHMYMGSSLANSCMDLALLLDHPVLPSFGDGAQALVEHRRSEQALRALLARKEDLAALDRNAPPGEQSSQAYLTH